MDLDSEVTHASLCNTLFSNKLYPENSENLTVKGLNY